jgi:transposase
MDEPRRVTTCVGIDVSKDRLDVHALPSGNAFAVARDGKAWKISLNVCRRSTCR